MKDLLIIGVSSDHERELVALFASMHATGPSLVVLDAWAESLTDLQRLDVLKTAAALEIKKLTATQDKVDASGFPGKSNRGKCPRSGKPVAQCGCGWH